MQQPLICKYWTPHLKTILTYIDALLTIEKDSGYCLLHYILREQHIDNMSLQLVLDGCRNRHSDHEGAALAALICEELLAMPLNQRLMLTMPKFHIIGKYGYCIYGHGCDFCTLYRTAKESEEKK